MMSGPAKAAQPGSCRRYRVVQWATGNVGSRALRRAIEHPDLEVVGVWVHSRNKAGRDAGELAGLGANGSPIILYSNNENDLTQVILDELNAAAPPEALKTPEKPPAKKAEKKK